MTVASSSPAFDESKAYIPHPPEGQPWFDDGREIQLLHFVYNQPNLEQIRGYPRKVLDVIDEFAKSQQYLMNVGHAKGKIVTDLIEEVRPATMIELGGYVGYSTILFADAVRRAGGRRYLSLERNPEFAAVATLLVDLAGLRDFVRIIIGRSDLSLHELCSSGEVDHVELMFLDHYKPAYTTDLKLCEYYGMISPGTVLAADNVLSPGNPPYLEYVRSSVAQKRRAVQDGAGKGYNYEGIKERTKNQYKNKEGDEQPVFDFPGNPNIVYESTLYNSFEPTGEPDGVEITKCVGVEQES
ncbi:catechol O-methyltransferase [Paecilomyces variotii No. 5]|uniref:catechol O-methyltransferase n=1 Tax=Byssochlamys spectabilis (strain No. 5 / NBRC 109023) TaxID=1356009 RepID=V5FQL7_BYSSN|nr:catechol O-methyltransferase [Paecilomyces variotii No. 5]